jgi:hypothetical protein
MLKADVQKTVFIVLNFAEAQPLLPHANTHRHFVVKTDPQLNCT